MQYLFIVGCARTGSTLLRSVLEGHPRVSLLTELHFAAPRWIRRDFLHAAAGLPPLDTEAGVEALLDLMYSGRPKGTFWTTGTGERDRVDSLSREQTREALRASDRTLPGVLRALVEAHARAVGADIAGAKFPVELSRTPWLREVVPDCKILHTTRDPRAIWSSMVKNEARHAKRLGQWSDPRWSKLRRYPYLIDQYRKAAALHRRYGDDPRYLLSRFEELVLDPEAQVRRLCAFLEIEPTPAMLEPPVRNSSYRPTNEPVGVGMDRATLERWRQATSARAQRAITLALSGPMRTLGYSAE